MSAIFTVRPPGIGLRATEEEEKKKKKKKKKKRCDRRAARPQPGRHSFGSPGQLEGRSASCRGTTGPRSQPTCMNS
ncbi:hypothetical protein EYF80_044945 [Liparis tanakae]|uniref:Uncharacterized protein n=1 Tax=Liparis tanakae TaxID=230148 RepID=A0A4Z2FUF9_9TELE|nr:hypothetical protein EYF80_044945 [Liparis tanakae]